MSSPQPWLTPTGPPPAPPLRRLPNEGRSRAPRLRRDHPVATAFLDETGAIAQDRIFGIGLLKVTEPARLLRAVQKLRDRRHWYGEIKFSQVRERDLTLYKEVIDIALAPGAAEFFCFIADRHVADPVARFGSTWDAYAKLAEQLVVASAHQTELLTVLADNYSTPDHILFEEDLRSTVNRRLRRLAVVSVCRLDSRSSDGLQVVDLLTSATAFEFRAAAGSASLTSHKAELAAYVRTALGTDTCLKGWRNSAHSVAVYNSASEEVPQAE